MPGLSHATYPPSDSDSPTDAERAAVEHEARAQRAREDTARRRGGMTVPLDATPNMYGRVRRDPAASKSFVPPLPGAVVWVLVDGVFVPGLLVEVLPAGADVGRVPARVLAHVSRPDSDHVDTRLLEVAVVADRAQAIAMSENAARPVAASLA